MSSRLLVGTSGWSYDDWIGRVYPEGLDRRDYLSYYSTIFNTVEINLTFYRTPFKNMVIGWGRKCPDDFVFSVKGSRLVTHYKKLSEVEEIVSRFYENLSNLKGLEVILWQLPPSMKSDPFLLDNFLCCLPKGMRYVIEFRHPSWWEDGEVVKVLSRHNAGFCGVSHPKLPSRFIDTSDFCYVRFHGLGQRLYDYDYSDNEMLIWVEVAREMIRVSKDVYIYFNNDYHANAVKNAKRFREMV